uniref:Sushi domain-containing protein n=1 Tax=Ciona savignyi TaxID=51511 RepID=H2ZL61_CIOSA
MCNFQCEDGFRMTGAVQTTCKSDGWSVGEAPTCTKITCPIETEEMVAGTESCDRSNEFNSECRYTCNHGYELVGTQFSRTCSKTGRWSARRPTCVEIKCPVLFGISHGDVICKGERRLDSECMYVCDATYRIKGNNRVRCMDTKQWEPNINPICERAATLPPPTTNTSPITTTTTRRTTTTTATTTTTMPTTTTRPTTTTAVPPTMPPKPPTNVVGVHTTQPPVDIEPTVAPVPRDGDQSQTDPPTQPSAGGIPIIPIVVGIVVIVLVIVGLTLFIVWRRRNRKPKIKGFGVTRHHDHSEQLQKLVPNGSSNRRYPSIPV